VWGWGLGEGSIRRGTCRGGRGGVVPSSGSGRSGQSWPGAAARRLRVAGRARGAGGERHGCARP
jgi:hypothetical protein